VKNYWPKRRKQKVRPAKSAESRVPTCRKGKKQKVRLAQRQKAINQTGVEAISEKSDWRKVESDKSDWCKGRK
jgi:hypothetical protein